MTTTTFSTYIKRVGGVETCSVTVECETVDVSLVVVKTLQEALEEEMGKFFPGGGEKEETVGVNYEGKYLSELLLLEKIIDTPGQVKSAIMNGMVRKMDREGNWRIVSSLDASVRPGWWKITKKGVVKIGENYVIEKKMCGDKNFVKQKLI